MSKYSFDELGFTLAGAASLLAFVQLGCSKPRQQAAASASPSAASAPRADTSAAVSAGAAPAASSSPYAGAPDPSVTLNDKAIWGDTHTAHFRLPQGWKNDIVGVQGRNPAKTASFFADMRNRDDPYPAAGLAKAEKEAGISDVRWGAFEPSVIGQERLPAQVATGEGKGNGKPAELWQFRFTTETKIDGKRPYIAFAWLQKSADEGARKELMAALRSMRVVDRERPAETPKVAVGGACGNHSECVSGAMCCWMGTSSQCQSDCRTPLCESDSECAPGVGCNEVGVGGVKACKK